MPFAMQVEEDLSSQFVDFTNATDSEQFISDVEQALVDWHLVNKGHASLEALTAASAKRLPQSRRQAASLDAAVWTKELQFQPPGVKTSKSYTLALFVASYQGTRQEKETSVPGKNATKKLKQWQEGLEHFTPTMEILVLCMTQRWSSLTSPGCSRCSKFLF